jgi:hypothetical protein
MMSQGLGGLKLGLRLDLRIGIDFQVVASLSIQSRTYSITYCIRDWGGDHTQFINGTTPFFQQSLSLTPHVLVSLQEHYHSQRFIQSKF